MIRTIACNELVRRNAVTLGPAPPNSSPVRCYPTSQLILLQGIGLPVEFGTSPATLLFRDKDWKPPEPATKFIAKL